MSLPDEALAAQPANLCVITSSNVDAPPAAPRLRPQPTLDFPGQMDMGTLPTSSSVELQSRNDSYSLQANLRPSQPAGPTF